METDYFVCVVCCHKYMDIEDKKQQAAKDLIRCAEENIYFIDCDGHFGAMDGITNYSMIILRYNAKYVGYGEVKEAPDRIMGKRYIKVNEWNWRNPKKLESGVRVKGLMEHVIGSKNLGDKVKKVEPEYAVEIINEIKSARKKHKIGQQKR